MTARSAGSTRDRMRLAPDDGGERLDVVSCEFFITSLLASISVELDIDAARTNALPGAGSRLPPPWRRPPTGIRQRTSHRDSDGQGYGRVSMRHDDSFLLVE